MNPSAAAQEAIDNSFRSYYGKLVSKLLSRFGLHNIDLIENAVMDAYYSALKTWPYEEKPGNTEAWLYRVSQRKLIDSLRNKNHKHEALNFRENAEDELDFENDEIKDPELRLLFLVCHNTLKAEDQLAFMLKTLSGLGTKEISKALMQNESAIKKRLLRARKKLKAEKVTFEWPDNNEIAERLAHVHTVLYLLFNEGFCSNHSEQWIRKDMCLEAMRFCKYLVDHPIANQDTQALMSLMCYHISRFESRTNENGGIVTLTDQNRKKWNTFFIDLGHHYLEKSAKTSKTKSVYQLEAFISAQHCMASSIDNTDWKTLKLLYQSLYQLKKHDLVLLNLIVVLLYLQEIDLAKSYYERIDADKIRTNKISYYMVGIELYNKLQNQMQIELLIEKAIQTSDSPKEQRHLKQRFGRV